jgi:hypothetical protein
MTIVVALGLSGAFMVLQPVQVDFKIDSAPLSPVTAPVPADPSGYGQPLAFDTPIKPPQAILRPILARGFGDDIPLAFAIRQIVPATVKVEYGSSVDRDVRVSWIGGKPWRQVLHTTLSPLGIHAAQSGGTIRITE